MIRLTRAQVREVDRRAIEEYGIPGIVLMENAAHAVADAAIEMIGPECIGQVLVLCGPGNNGGDGLAAARHLHNRGADVFIALATDPARYRGDALTNWRIVQAMKLAAEPIDLAKLERSTAVLIIDAIFGTGLIEPPREPFAQIVRAVQHSRVPVLAIDLPSGLDCDSGEPLGPACIRATRTVSLVAEKAGFANPDSRQYTGEVVVGDIGVPPELIEQVASLA
jgi:NAD(P)H-hydrate epimerase